MRKSITHGKCYQSCRQFADTTLGFLPESWCEIREAIAYNFRVIDPLKFRVVG
jgi:hypothetical protein